MTLSPGPLDAGMDKLIARALSRAPVMAKAHDRKLIYALVTELSKNVGELDQGASLRDTQPGSADRWADLERLAKAATPKRWKPFWGDAVEAVMCARTDEEVVFWTGFDASRTATTKAKRRALMNFIAAADPSTVLELIAAARAKEAGE